MARHPFNFDGGEELTTMGAAWFVSYCWYDVVDKSHTNWQNVSTCCTRISVYNRTRRFHKFWLEQVVKMNENNLNKNTIKLKGRDIINMAAKLLKVI